MPLFKRNDIFAGRYELNELMGESGFSEVWKARDQMAEDAVVCLKICTSEKEPAEEAVYKFRRQFFISQLISHPHLLKVSYFDVSEGFPYLLMPFCPEGSLANLASRQGAVSERKIALILCQIGSALEALHQQNPSLLHGNVKPENILATQEDYFFLADISASNGPRDPLAGSPPISRGASTAYAPPESIDQFRQADASGDIFSLGVTLYEIASKTLPWAGKGGQALLKGEKVPVLPEQYSAELNELLQACMSVNKNKRPTAQELHLRGKQFLESGHWHSPEKDGEKLKPLKKRISYLSAAALLVLLILGAYWGDKNNRLDIPAERLQHEKKSNLDEMLIATLEDQLEEMSSRALELEKENQQLKQNDALAEGQLEKPALAVFSPSGASPEKGKKLSASGDFEEQLNKISDPAIPGKAREAWRKEILAQFSEGTVRILDETNGTPKRFSTHIFINLLYKVPHTVVVKEVKRDQNKKVSELRLEMHPKG